MWQRFTERARKVIFYAQEEAQNFGEGYVSTEHILLGILRESDNTAVMILARLGKHAPAIREEVVMHMPKGDAPLSQDMTLTPRAKRVIDLAYDEARYLNNNYIGSEHLLLGLIREGDGLAGRVLDRAGVKLKDARKMTHQIQSEDPNRPPPQPYTPPPTPPRRPPDLRVNYNLHLLQPVDQMLIAILSDRQSPFAERLRQSCPSLDFLLPSILATMAQDSGERWPLEQTVAVANRMAREASREEVSMEDLFVASLAGTGEEVRKVLGGLDLAPND